MNSTRNSCRSTSPAGTDPGGLWAAVLLAVLAVLPPMAAADDLAALDDQVRDLKAEAIDVNQELFLLEEELLFPANTQVAVYLSMDTGNFFDLDSVQLTIDGVDVANYLYTEREVKALRRGGVHRVYMGNLKSGQHELVAVFTGEGPHQRDYRRATSLSFDKGLGAHFLELVIADNGTDLQPGFEIREWGTK